MLQKKKGKDEDSSKNSGHGQASPSLRTEARASVRLMTMVKEMWTTMRRKWILVALDMQVLRKPTRKKSIR